MPDDTPPSTPRGILTPKQREFLATPEDERQEKYTRQQRYRWRTQIRDRVTNAMFDFARLRAGLSDDELEEIFSGPDVHELDDDDDLDDLEADRVARAGAPQVIAFLARAHDLDDAPVFPDFGRHQGALNDLFDTFDRGIEKWLASEKDTLATVRTDVEIEDARPADAVVEQARRGEPVSVGGSVLADRAALDALARTDEERELLFEAHTEHLREMEKYDFDDGVLEELSARSGRSGDGGGEADDGTGGE